MKNILIFRTDRIGSNLNFNYVKSFNIFNNVFLFPRNFLEKIKFFFSLKKYDKILVLDGKKRSIYMSLFKRANKKILFTPSIFIKKFFFLFFDKSYLIDYKIPKIDLIVNCLNELNCNFIDEDLNFLKKHENKNSLTDKNYYSNYIIFNFDEKWLSEKYIKSYINIEPTLDELIVFLNIISVKRKIIITNGFIKNHLIEKLQYLKNKNYLNDVIIKDKIDIYELQSLIRNSDFFISCHGGPTHMASSYSIKLIDIIDLSEKEFFESYNYHIKNKSQLFREKFSLLSEKILKIIN